MKFSQILKTSLNISQKGRSCGQQIKFSKATIEGGWAAGQEASERHDTCGTGKEEKMEESFFSSFNSLYSFLTIKNRIAKVVLCSFYSNNFCELSHNFL